MTADELRKLFPNASEQFIRANADTPPSPSLPARVGGSASRPVVERRVRPRPLAARKNEGPNPARFFVRVTSFRRRLLDEDNLCEKYFVDCCRYAGLLPGDDAGQARIVTTQEKVGRKEDERTEIVIELLSPPKVAPPMAS